MDITAILRIINQVVPEKYQPAAIVALILGGFGWKVYQAKNTKHEDLKTAIKDKNTDRIKKEMEELSKVSHKLAEEIYKAAAAKQQGAGGAGPGGPQAGPGPEAGPQQADEPKKSAKGKDDVIDAEFKEE